MYQKVAELLQERNFQVQCNVIAPFSEFRAIKRLGTSTILTAEEAHRHVHGC